MVKRGGNTTESLIAAKKAKNDEFYTQLPDIERELKHYKKHLKGKVILCNCDDPRVSNFFRYFYCNFCDLGIKKLISVCYKNLNPDLFSQNKDEQAVYCIHDGTEREDDECPEKDLELFLRKNKGQRLKGDGDFRSKECIELLKQSDIVVTNPPFSLFREYVAQLVEYNKKFVIIGNKNAITYKETFKLIKENKFWIGMTPMGHDMLFEVPNEVAEEMIKTGKEGSSYRLVDGKVYGRSTAIWFTNLDIKKRHEELKLYKTYNATEYPKYDNYDAIEVSKVVDIPVDYNGVMGVPISFLDKYNPEQFEILGSADDKSFYPIVFGKYTGRITIQGSQPFKRLFIRRINTWKSDYTKLQYATLSKITGGCKEKGIFGYGGQLNEYDRKVGKWSGSRQEFSWRLLTNRMLHLRTKIECRKCPSSLARLTATNRSTRAGDCVAKPRMDWFTSRL